MQTLATAKAARVTLVCVSGRDDVVSAYAVERVRAWLQGGQGRTQAELARKAGVSTAQISNLLDGTRGAGKKTLRGIAAALETTWPELEEQAVAWGRARGMVASPTERYPHRVDAAKIATEGGISSAAIESVLGDALDSNEDPSVLWWLDRMRMREAMLRSQRVPGTPVEDIEPPPRGRKKP